MVWMGEFYDYIRQVPYYLLMLGRSDAVCPYQSSYVYLLT